MTITDAKMQPSKKEKKISLERLFYSILKPVVFLIKKTCVNYCTKYGEDDTNGDEHPLPVFPTGSRRHQLLNKRTSILVIV